MIKQYQLWLQLTRRDIAARHKGSYLGVVWLLLTPILEFSVYSTVFGVIFGGHYLQNPPEPKPVYALGVFLCLTLYRFIAETISVSPGIIVSQPNFVKKVVFPLHLLPLSIIGGLSYRTLLSLSLFCIGFIMFGPGFSLQLLWAPLVLTPLVLLAIGISWALSALGVFLRDISQVAGVSTLIMLYASGVFYSMGTIQTRSQLAWDILKYNPLLHIMENSRRVILWKAHPHAEGLLYTWAVSLFCLYAGFKIFKKLRPTFADVI